MGLLTKEPIYRHELKYLISTAQIELLKDRINGIMQLDPHVSASGKYTIRSLYFDDYHNRCFYENENGNDPRAKYRIRIYNHATDRISLECKQKERGKTRKEATRIDLEQAILLMNGKYIASISEQPPLLRYVAQ